MRSVNGVVDPSVSLSREVGLESDDNYENILFALTNLFDGFFLFWKHKHCWKL